MSHIRFPDDVRDLTPELLSSVLAERHPGVRVDDLRVVSTASCGDGHASTADRVALELEFAPGRDAGVPRRVLLKTMLLRPHAPEAMYRNEVRFYRDVRPELEIEAPRAFGSAFDPETARFGIVMEDLALRGARFPNVETTTTEAEIRGVLATLAALHAHFWESPRFETNLAWLATPLSGGMYPVFHGYGLAFLRDQLDKHPWKSELLAPLGRSLEQLWQDLWALQAVLASGPQTLLHGDPHLGNTYLLPTGAGDTPIGAGGAPAGAGGLLDWQLMVRGRWSHDVSYLLVTGLAPALRRAHERELLDFYLDSLHSHGVADAPTRAEAFGLYRRSVVWGLVIGWLITPPENYGEPITRANIERIVTAAVDLESFAVV